MNAEPEAKPKVAVFLCHPRADSLCAALANAYVEGAERAGVAVELIRLGDLSFCLNVTERSPGDQPIEPELQPALDALTRAVHLVFVYPTWWATMPALLKGFLDRTLLPGVAFRTDERSPTGYVPLLKGRSAQIITTMDSPGWVYRFACGRAGDRAMKSGILGFCGIRPVKSLWVTEVKDRAPSELQRGIDCARALGADLPRYLARLQRRKNRWAWFRITRLQFYALTLLSYSLGAVAARPPGIPFPWPIFLLGFAFLFVLEFCSVLANEIYDRDTDRLNQNAGPFTGGSQVLVEGALPAEQVKGAAVLSLVAAACLGVLLLFQVKDGAFPAVLTLLAIGFFLGPGYTVPPLKFVYRGLGEWIVATSHSVFMVLCGWVFVGGDPLAALPWILSAPMFFAIFAAIALAGIPDSDADSLVGKHTLAVLLGTRRVALIALLTTFAATFLFLGLRVSLLPPPSHSSPGATAGFVFHGTILGLLLVHFLRGEANCRRIDAILFAALSFILWFSVWPLLARLG